MMTEIDLKEGLSTVQYQLLKYEERPLYTWMQVDLNSELNCTSMT